MSPRAAARLAWCLAGLCLAGTIVGLVFTGLNGAFHRQFIGPFASVAGALIAFPAVGALVAAIHRCCCRCSCRPSGRRPTQVAALVRTLSLSG
jgi:hypothetical protein